MSVLEIARTGSILSSNDWISWIVFMGNDEMWRNHISDQIPVVESKSKLSIQLCPADYKLKAVLLTFLQCLPLQDYKRSDLLSQ